MAKETLEHFIKKLPSYPKAIINEALSEWDRGTLDIMGKAQEITPVASGNLQGSARFKRATVKPFGIQSYILFKAPYAKHIHNGEGKMRLKEAGELSYYAGHRVYKKSKGQFKFLQKAINNNYNILLSAVGDAVVKAFNRL